MLRCVVCSFHILLLDVRLGRRIPRFLTRNEEFVYEEFLVRKTDEENEELTSIKRLILGGKSRKKCRN